MKKLIITILFLCLVLSNVSAQPPFATETLGGLTLVSIEPPVTHQAQMDYMLHVHVLNSTDSKIINTSLTCFYHLSDVDGYKIAEGYLNLTTTSKISNLSYVATIKGGNFSDYGMYNVLQQCYQDTTLISGISRIVINVSPSGKSQSTPEAMASFSYMLLMIALLAFLGWLGFKLTMSPYLWVLGIFFLFVSLLLLVYDVWLAAMFYDYLANINDSNLPQVIFYIFMASLVIGLLVSVALLLTHWKDLIRYIKKEFKKEKKDEDEDEGLDL